MNNNMNNTNCKLKMQENMRETNHPIYTSIFGQNVPRKILMWGKLVFRFEGFLLISSGKTAIKKLQLLASYWQSSNKIFFTSTNRENPTTSLFYNSHCLQQHVLASSNSHWLFMEICIGFWQTRFALWKTRMSFSKFTLASSELALAL